MSNKKKLLRTFRKERSKRDKDDTKWVLNLQDFYLALIDRRIKRITNWINLNLTGDEALNETLKRQKQRFLEYAMRATLSLFEIFGKVANLFADRERT